MPADSEQYHSGAHCRYLTQYHVIWCPKFRYAVLKDGKDEALKIILQETCAKYRYSIEALEVMPDHVHIFVDAPQTAAPYCIAKTRKNFRAIKKNIGPVQNLDSSYANFAS